MTETFKAVGKILSSLCGGSHRCHVTFRIGMLLDHGLFAPHLGKIIVRVVVKV